MRKLILIKHARPQVNEGLPPEQWSLSEEGRRSCGPLADALCVHDPALIVTSTEAKARETGRLIGAALRRPVAVAENLHEHDRGNVPLLPGSEFISLMALFFKDRARLVLGRETAEQALCRFGAAVDSVLQAHPQGNIAIVTHGTVLALFAAGHGAGDAFQLWRQMALPSAIVFAVPGFELIAKMDKT